MSTYWLPYTAGTVSVTTGTTTVTGTLTAWLTNVKIGDRFKIGSVEGIVSAVNSNTSITLATGWGGSTVSGSTYSIDRYSRGWFAGGDLALALGLYNSNRPTFIPTVGKPADVIGSDGNVAFDKITNIVYKKSAGVWDNGTSIVGPSGELTRSGAVTAGNLASWVSNTQVKAATAAEVRAAGGGLREVLTANRVYYVSPDGSNSNTGLGTGPESSLLTIQNAIDKILALDCNGYAVTVEMVHGSFSGTISVTRQPLGWHNITIRGATGSACTLAFTTGGSAFVVSHGRVTLENLTVTNSGATGQGVLLNNRATLNIGAGVTFGACPNRYHIEATGGSGINVNQNYTIAGGALAHYALSSNSSLAMSGRTITITGTPAFSSFLLTSQGAIASLSSNTWSGAATGSRYNVTGNSVVDTFGAGESHLPGSTAGVTATGGQYI